jgi:hypothetical protein
MKNMIQYRKFSFLCRLSNFFQILVLNLKFILAHIFLTVALDGGEWWASSPGHFTLWERTPFSQWIGGWWSTELVWTLWRRQKSLSAGNRTLIPDHPASNLVIMLSYPGSVYKQKNKSTGPFSSSASTKNPV